MAKSIKSQNEDCALAAMTDSDSSVLFEKVVSSLKVIKDFAVENDQLSIDETHDESVCKNIKFVLKKELQISSNIDSNVLDVRLNLDTLPNLLYTEREQLSNAKVNIQKIFVNRDDCIPTIENKNKYFKTEPHQTEDGYEHPVKGLIYITTSFPGTGVEDFVIDQIKGCICQNLCNEDCECHKSYGFAYPNGRLVDNHSSIPIFECNYYCGCDDTCRNRLVQRGPVNCLVIDEIPKKGMGVKTTEFIRRGSFVCEYAGEYIGIEEACKRFSKQQNADSNYILMLKEHVSSLVHRVTIIDATLVGNVGRYINHSCDPNLVIVPVRVDSMVPIAALFAAKDICPGDELCYDYGIIKIVDNSLIIENGQDRCTVIPKRINLVPKLFCESEAISQVIIKKRKFGMLCDGCGKLTVEPSYQSPAELSNKKVPVSGLVNIRDTTLDKNSDSVCCNEPGLALNVTITKPCLCLSSNCRGFLPTDNSLF